MTTTVHYSRDLYLLDDYGFVTWLLQDHDEQDRYNLSTYVLTNLRTLYEQYQREHQEATS